MAVTLPPAEWRLEYSDSFQGIDDCRTYRLISPDGMVYFWEVGINDLLNNDRYWLESQLRAWIESIRGPTPLRPQQSSSWTPVTPSASPVPTLPEGMTRQIDLDE